MRSFVNLVIRHPLAVLISIIMTCLAGAWCACLMPVNLFPGMDIPVVNIVTHYPGAAPADIEIMVSVPIENEMRSIPGVKRVSSTSVQGISAVTVEFAWGVAINDARQIVMARLARVGGEPSCGGRSQS